MYIVITCSIIAIFLTYLDTRKILKNGMFWGFCLVTMLGCIHYNYGNDYEVYETWFKENTSFAFHFNDLFDGTYNWAPGWVMLNHLFKKLGGFFGLVIFINILQNFIYYKSIKDYVPDRWRVLAVSIYLLSQSLYLLNFSMMRQGFAVSIFLLAWSFIKKRDFLKALCIIFVASLFHSSAQILLPFAFCGLIPQNKGKLVAGIMFFTFIVLYANRDFLQSIFNQFIVIDKLSSTESLTYYANDELQDRSYGLGFFLNLLPFFVGLYMLYFQQIESQNIPLIILGLFGFLIAPFGNILTILLRFSYYSSAYQVICIPYIYSQIKNEKIRYVFVTLYCLMLVYGYWHFFMSPVWSRAYSTFHTIFEVI